MGKRYFDKVQHLDIILDGISTKEMDEFYGYLYKASALIKDNSILVQDTDHFFSPTYISTKEKLDRFEDLQPFIYTLGSDSIKLLNEMVGEKFMIVDIEDGNLVKSTHISDGVTDTYKFVRIKDASKFAPLVFDQARKFSEQPERKGARYGTLDHLHSIAYMDSARIKRVSLDIEDDRTEMVGEYVTTYGKLKAVGEGLSKRLGGKKNDVKYITTLLRALGKPLYVVDTGNDAALVLYRKVDENGKATGAIAEEGKFSSKQPLIYERAQNFFEGKGSEGMYN